MDALLEGRHALVCGGSEGIGRASAEALASMGARVTVLSRTAAKLEAVAAALPRPHAAQSHGWLAVDVRDRASLQSQVQALCAASPVHILVNNTAGPAGGSAHSADADAYLEVFQQHLIANQVLLQAVLPGMRAAAVAPATTISGAFSVAGTDRAGDDWIGEKWHSASSPR